MTQPGRGHTPARLAGQVQLALLRRLTAGAAAAGCAVTLGQAVGLDIEAFARPLRASPLRLAQHSFSQGEVDFLSGARTPGARQPRVVL